MKITPSYSFQTIQRNQTTNNNKSYQYNSSPKPKTTSPNFGMLIVDDLYYWGVRKANKNFLEQTAKQLVAIRKDVLNDVELLSKRHGVSKTTVENHYDKYIKRGGIKPKYDGKEVGLNRIIGYSMEKFELLKQLVVPVLDNAKSMKAGKTADNPMPHGLILYGRAGSGKKYLADSLLEHFSYKAAEEGLPIKTIKVSGQWWQGGTEENVELLKAAFSQARKNGQENNHTVIYIEKLGELLTAENGDVLKAELIKQTQHPQKDKFTWIATVDDIKDLSRPFLKSSRVNMYMEIDKTSSESESLALLNHFISKTGRASEYDEEYIQSYIRDSKIPSIPKKIRKIVEFADNELRMAKDYSTPKKGTFIAPINNMQLMMGADFVSKYNRNRVLSPFEKKEVIIPDRLKIKTDRAVLEQG